MSLFQGVPYEYTATANGFVFTASACPLDDEGRIVAPGDLDAQALRAAENLLVALAEADARPKDLLKTTIYVVGTNRSDLVRAWDTRMVAVAVQGHDQSRLGLERTRLGTR